MPSEFNTEHSLESQFDHPERVKLDEKWVDVVDVHPSHPKTEVPVLVAPGWITTPNAFRENILALATHGRRAIAINAPHGIPAKHVKGFPDPLTRKATAVLEALKVKGIESTDAIGHSEGALYLVIAATLHPERFRNIVLVNPAGMIGTDSVDRLARRFGKEMLQQTIAGTHDDLLRQKNLRSALQSGRTLEGNVTETMRQVHALATFPINDLLRKLKQQGIGIVVIHTTEDQAFPMERVQKVAKSDQMDGFLSMKGIHNEALLNPQPITAVVEEMLSALEKKQQKKE